jgi:transposase
MLSEENQMEVLEAYDLTRSFRAAAQLTGVDHHTVARYVKQRAAGETVRPERTTLALSFADKIADWVKDSSGKVRADVVHDRLVVMGYSGSERTTRRAVRSLKQSYRRSNHRIYKPWIPEPGLWLQYDFGDGPVVDGRKTVLFCAWLAWSRFRVIIALADRTMPSVVFALDKTLRTIGGAPTYVLTDNEKTVTDRHICGIAVRNQTMVAVSVYYGVTVCTCVAYDPESKGGSESTVKIAKADLCPTDANLRDEYQSFEELERACAEATDIFNNRVHSVTRRIPAQALKDEACLLHSLPDFPYTLAFGESRHVSWSSTVCFRGARYSVPHALVDCRVFVREHSGEVVIVSGSGSSARIVATHALLPAGQASIEDSHYPVRKDPLSREPKATNSAEQRFIDLGDGAKLYLTEAAAAGVRRIEAKMAKAVVLSALHGQDNVDRALGLAAMSGRFRDGDLESILVHSSQDPVVTRSKDAPSLASSTSHWSRLGQKTTEA